ncbi:MAG: hypothetical protein IPL61_25975 [Myxococcales bacterium]|nr:hypothetical protein [Myxococcales bacterium]
MAAVTPPRPAPDPAALQRLQRTAAAVIGIPAVLGVILALAQAWPATMVIDALARDDGRYSLKAAILGTIALLLLAVLAALIPIVLIVRVVRRR